MTKFILALMICGVSSTLVAQVRIIGNVKDKLSNEPIVFANVYITQDKKIIIGTISDLDGNFAFESLSSGIYFLNIAILGYIEIRLPFEIKVNDILEFQIMMEQDENVIFSNPVEIIEKPYKSGNLTMTQQQYKVMPASFQDPSRIMLRYPGFSTENDQANSILFRGMPPEATRWQLFGADIVNPNHLSNAGTANDLATGNAGGVNAFSGSVLDYYHFEANPADISYANVLSGVSDMKMAPKIKSFVDLNLIGLEAGLNFNAGENAAGYFKNVYAAYRYSFVGILNQLGVDFGNEKIGYQDISMHADLYRSYNKSLKIFSTLGTSRNLLSPVIPSDSITRYKDLQQIDYKSKLGIGGIQYVWDGYDRIFRSTLVSSFRTDTRNELTDASSVPDLGFVLSRNNTREEHMISSHTVYEFRPEMEADLGIFLTIGLRMNLFSNSFIKNQDGEVINGFLMYPYYQMEGTIKEKWKYKMGIGLLYENISRKLEVEPLFNLQYAINKNLSLSFDYRYSTMQNITELEQLNRLDNEFRIKSINLQSGAEYKSKEKIFRSSFFYHEIWDISNYTLSNGTSTGHFSAFNGSNLGYDQYINYPEVFFNGVAYARSYGMDMYFENRINIKSNALQYQINGSLFESSYSLPEAPDQYYVARYNFRFSANASVAYFLNFPGSDRNKSLIIALAGHHRGPLRTQPILEDPLSMPYNISDYNRPYTETFRPYQRLDFRVVYTKKKVESRFSHRWSLDIQNVLNRENDGFRYYDPYLDKIVMQLQLGLVPVLSYRLEW